MCVRDSQQVAEPWYVAGVTYTYWLIDYIRLYRG